MEYRKEIVMKDGRTCVVRSGTAADGEGALHNFVLTHAETDFLTTYPEETTITPEREAAWLERKRNSPREAELMAEVEGKIVGTAGVDPVRCAEKTRHRASFGISIEKAFWGLGVGRALTEACIACAKSAGYTQMELEAVADNHRALALYQSVGFVEYGRNPKAFFSRFSGWQETVLMRLELDKRP